MSACAEFSTENQAESDQDICRNLKQVVAAYPAKFASLKRGAPSSNPWNNARVWNTKPVFSDTECEIWSWAKGLANYSCQWEESGEEGALAVYDEYKPKIQNCLGENWTVSDLEAKTGKHSIYQSETTKAVVSIRYFQDTRPPFSKPWYTSMIIGDLIQNVGK